MAETRSKQCIADVLALLTTSPHHIIMGGSDPAIAVVRSVD
jgi:hypothetical protein